MDAKKLLAAIDAVVQRGDDPKRLYQLGYELHELKLYHIAATVLSKGIKIAPNVVDLVAKLVLNLEMLMQNEEAVKRIQALRYDWKQVEILRYLLAFNLLMIGDITVAQQTLKKPKSYRTKQYQEMAGLLQGMLNRDIFLKKHRASRIAHRDSITHGDERAQTYRSDKFRECKP